MIMFYLTLLYLEVFFTVTGVKIYCINYQLHLLMNWLFLLKISFEKHEIVLVDDGNNDDEGGDDEYFI